MDDSPRRRNSATFSTFLGVALKRPEIAVITVISVQRRRVTLT